ncbi:YcaO-like family protein [Streptomyces sp. NPDC088182]|uniref:YcaO-like family protein n=1 Tax=Streptomyces sp. NPDC088182 TaxID=3365838 RepID=UPI0037F6BF91
MSAWTPQVFAPFPDHPEVLLARVAARSAAFEGTSAADGRPVLVGSAAGHDRNQVAAGARGELLERMGNIMAGRAAEAAAETVGTAGQLRDRGLAVRDPWEEVPGRRLWACGATATGERVYVPASAVYLQHRPPPGCEASRGGGSTGVAAHPRREAAVGHAAWEVLERDLVRRSWYGLTDTVPHALPVTLPPALRALLDDRGLRATAFGVPAPPGAACAVVCLHQPDGTEQAFGARCGPDADVPHLVERAAYEALMVTWSMGTPVARRTWARWRGGTEPTTAVQHALWAHHVQDSLGHWKVKAAAPRPEPARPAHHRRPPPSSGCVPGPAPGPVPGPVPGADPLRILARHTGQEPIVVETTSSSARVAGVHVVRVLAPGAEPLPTGAAAGPPHPFG